VLADLAALQNKNNNNNISVFTGADLSDLTGQTTVAVLFCLFV
jgi:hypothetical protein